MNNCETCKHWNHKEQFEDPYETTRAECWRLVDVWPARDFVCVHHEKRIFIEELAMAPPITLLPLARQVVWDGLERLSLEQELF